MLVFSETESQGIENGGTVKLRAEVSSCRSSAGCPSGQRERTVNSPAYAYPGSNPGPATTSVLRVG